MKKKIYLFVLKGKNVEKNMQVILNTIVASYG